MTQNTLYHGDNLDSLRRYIKDETVDLVYFEPPFNRGITCSIPLGDQNGSRLARTIW